MVSTLQLGNFELEFAYRENFKLVSYNNVFSKESYEFLRNGFKDIAWKKTKASFYTQYESLIQPTDEHSLSKLYDPSFFMPFKSKLEKSLNVTLRNSARIVAHKLITADEIGIHNDYCDPSVGYENFRFIFQFSKTNELISGGELSFLQSPEKSNIIKQYPYTSNSGICFEITPNSFHYVAPVEGERYTIVIYLWEEGRKYDGSGIEVQ